MLLQDFLEQVTIIDNEVFLYLNQLGSEKWDTLWLFITEKTTWIILYLLILFFTLSRFGSVKIGVAFTLLLFAMVLVIEITSAYYFKEVTERLRPCYFPSFEGKVRLVQQSCGGLYSYFSGHASHSFALSFFFIFHFKRLPFLKFGLVLLCCLIAYSRIYVGVHFPLDIISGALWGIAWAYIFHHIFKMISHKY